MARRRQMRTRNQSPRDHRRSGALFEPLEKRQLLTVLSGSGQFTFSTTPPDDDGPGDPALVSYQNVTFEIIYYVAPAGDGAPPPFLTTNPSVGLEDYILHPFAIYVAESSTSSRISIARFDPENGDVLAYEGATEGWSIFENLANPVDDDDPTLALPDGTGELALGGLVEIPDPRDPENTILVPTVEAPVSLFAPGDGPELLPVAGGTITAGLTVADGNDFGRFLFGGSVLGQVSFGGSVDTFYAGNILTGNSHGETSQAATTIPGNFTVRGDIRNLLVTGSIGTDDGSESLLGDEFPIYLSGFHMVVGGSIGQIRAGGVIAGHIEAENRTDAPRLRLRQFEHEFRFNEDLPRQAGLDFENFMFGDAQDLYDNDTFETAQFLGTFNSRDLGPEAVQLHGNLQYTPLINDFADYYAVGLMAGQTIRARVIAPFTENSLGQRVPLINLGIFDPDGRLIDTDHGNGSNAVAQLHGDYISFTADRPGTYRFAIGANEDPDFSEDGEFSPDPFIPGEVGYQLQILGVANPATGGLAVGGIVAINGDDNEILDTVSSLAGTGLVDVHRGDLGAIETDNDIYGHTFQGVLVRSGNLRSIIAQNLGSFDEDAGAFSFGLDVVVPNGSVGLVRTEDAGATGIMWLNKAHDLAPSVGGSYQMVDAASQFTGAIIADRAIGTIRAGEMTTTLAPIFAANDDNVGNDGVIDLISVAGDMGNLRFGGPQISTGPSGNVRYIDVGGDAYRDLLFGGGVPEPTTFEPGEDVTITDDSGIEVTFEPIPLERQINFNNGTVTLINPGTITLTTLPVRRSRSDLGGGGGVVTLNVTTTRGLRVTTSGARGDSAEIGEIVATGEGTPVVLDNNGTPADPTDDFLRLSTTGEELNIFLDGAADIDVLNINSPTGEFVRIANRTLGEIVNITATSAGSVSGTNIGLAAKRHSGAAILPYDMFDFDGDDGADPVYPFNQQRTGLRFTGDVVEFVATQALGNIAVDGTIGRVRANSGRSNVGRVFEGIVGSVYAGGDLHFVDIGEGLLPSGGGNMAEAGLFAVGTIREVTNQGLGSDIRGDVVSETGIGTISLRDGAIINSDIGVFTTLAESREFILAPTYLEGPDNLTNPVFEIEAVNLHGRGGIIGSHFFAADIGRITVNEGFGIFSSSFNVPGDGVFEGFTVDGYGIRGSAITGGARIDDINVRTGGNKIATNHYTGSVRFSERINRDPYNGNRPNAVTDLHRYLGTTRDNPVRNVISNAGTIDDTLIAAGRSLDSVTAHQIRNSDFFLGNAINSIHVRDYIDDLDITTGRLNNVRVDERHVFNSSWQVSGPVGDIVIGGNWEESSVLQATGPEGNIGSFSTGAMLRGDILSSNDIGLISVGTHVHSRGLVNPWGINVGRNLEQLIVQGHILGITDLFTGGEIFNLIVGGDIWDGVTISTDNIRSQTINGSVFGDVIIR